MRFPKLRCDLLPLAGKRVVQVPKNDCQLVDLRGVVAVMSEKHKPGTMSDGALLRGAYQAGAAAVIKIGGGGGSICSRWEEVNRRLEVRGCPAGNNLSSFKGTLEDDFPFPKVGYVSFLEGIIIAVSRAGINKKPTQQRALYYFGRISRG